MLASVRLKGGEAFNLDDGCKSVSFLAVLTRTCVVVSNAIVDRVPNALTMRNQIPKSYLHYDLYCNLIPNEDENLPYFQQVPRTGAFEVSFKGMVSGLAPSLFSMLDFYFIYS